MCPPSEPWLLHGSVACSTVPFPSPPGPSCGAWLGISPAFSSGFGKATCAQDWLPGCGWSSSGPRERKGLQAVNWGAGTGLCPGGPQPRPLLSPLLTWGWGRCLTLGSRAGDCPGRVPPGPLKTARRAGRRTALAHQRPPPGAGAPRVSGPSGSLGHRDGASQARCGLSWSLWAFRAPHPHLPCWRVPLPWEPPCPWLQTSSKEAPCPPRPL